MRVFEDHKEPIPIPVDNNDDDEDEDDERSRKIRRVLKKKKPPSIIQKARKNQAGQADPIDHHPHHHHDHRMTTTSRRNEKALTGRSTNGSIKRAVSGSKTTRNGGSTMASSHSAAGYSCRSRGIYDVESLDLFRSYGCFLVYQIVVLLFIIFFLYTCL
ncbi:hypothetical protein PGT21_031925 [Puccinia graminis f. sp. tritici]|uniref:Uncharacterized protein n=1 Tax=Puccinia graminis f. sp. tritici TaxID=56615 RepID=A0A5B0QCD1_PUCGR|nr:hypothetical protein PGT21_031925 [Puccinia graminis f. sp. tritici]